MNVEAPARGLGGVLKSLNCDRAYGLSLLGACGLLLLLEFVGGDPLRTALQYDRAALAQGEWWRTITAHFIHLDYAHTLLNIFGLVLMWALFARDFSPLRWLAIYLAASMTISAGLWFFDPQVAWYRGTSGALHGVMAAGTLAQMRRRDFIAGMLAVFIVGKLGYEQWAGAMPFQDAGTTIVDAHLYGAVGGLATAIFLRSRREPP